MPLAKCWLSKGKTINQNNQCYCSSRLAFPIHASQRRVSTTGPILQKVKLRTRRWYKWSTVTQKFTCKAGHKSFLPSARPDLIHQATLLSYFLFLFFFFFFLSWVSAFSAFTMFLLYVHLSSSALVLNFKHSSSLLPGSLSLQVYLPWHSLFTQFFQIGFILCN